MELEDFDERSVKVCERLSIHHFREIGDKVVFERLSEKLCNKVNKYASYSFQELKGEMVKYKIDK